MNRMEQTRALRADQAVHYNCCQSVLVPFAQEMGLTPEQAFRLGSHFGAGMRHGATDCATLLKESRQRGEERKAHCDGLVYEMVEALDKLTAAAPSREA